MKPIAFMRLRQLDVPEDILKIYKPSELAIEQKFDGFKVMASRGQIGTRLYSRNGNDLTSKAPAIVKRLNELLSPGDTVLGEMVYISKGKQRLGDVQSVLHSKSPERAARKVKDLGGKLQYIVYDAIERKGKSQAKQPFNSRRKDVESKIPARGDVRRSRVYRWGQRSEAMKKAISTGGEGIVVKVRDSPYIYRRAGESEPWGKWWKHKVPGEKAHTEDVILLGYAKREKRLAFKMYQYKSGERVFVGFVSNLPRATEKDVQLMSDRNKPVVAEISHQERFPSGKFRHPGWIRLRPDKPLKSATMTLRSGEMPRKTASKNPMTRRKDYNVYLLSEGAKVIRVHSFGSKEFIQPTVSAKYCQLLAEGDATTHIVHGDAKLRKILREKKSKRILPGKRVRTTNPRNSKVKDALATEATRFRNFEDFSKAYWNECARGLYWIATNEKRFHIGEDEKRRISGGAFYVACNPVLAMRGKGEGKKFVAELDVTRLPPGSISVKRGTSGTEIKITGNAESIRVTRVLDALKAKSSFRWQLSILPSSKEELRDFWAAAWEKRKRQETRTAMRMRKKREREEKRTEARRKEERVARERVRKKTEREEKKRAAARKKAGKAAMVAKKATSKKKPKRGKWKRVPTANPSPTANTRKILSHVNNPGS